MLNFLNKNTCLLKFVYFGGKIINYFYIFFPTNTYIKLSYKNFLIPKVTVLISHFKSLKIYEKL